MRPKHDPNHVERRIAALALAQHAFSRSNLLGLGLSSEGIARRLASGRLVALHRGVYSIGGTPATPERRWAAAVLACGPGAVLSHTSAAALWRIYDTDPVVLDVSRPGRGIRTRDGVRVHRPRHLGPLDCTVTRAVPATTVARTLIDCATVLGDRSVERMTDEAEYLGLLDLSQVSEAVARNRTRAARLRRVLDRHRPGSTRTRTPLEEAFFTLVRRAGLPQPLVNQPLGPYTIDFLWPEQRIAVETDGRAAHERAAARERDYGRDAWLHANGYLPMRFTWHQIHEREREVLAALHLLAASHPLRGNDPPIGGPFPREE